MKLIDNPVLRYGVRRYWRKGIVILPLLMLLGVGVGYLSVLASGFSLEQGGYMFLVWLGVALCAPALVLIPGMAPPIVAREYESKTYESLVLTLLAAKDIAIGKLVTATAPFLLAIAGSIPIAVLAESTLSVPRGGTIAIYVLAIVTVVNTSLLALVMAAMIKRSMAATLTTYVIVMLMVLLGLSIAGATLGGGGDDLWVLLVVIVVVGLFAEMVMWAMLLGALEQTPGLDEMEPYRYLPHGGPPPLPGGRSMEDLKSDGMAKF